VEKEITILETNNFDETYLPPDIYKQKIIKDVL
jgi:hypothetical protein